MNQTTRAQRTSSIFLIMGLIVIAGWGIPQVRAEQPAPAAITIPAQPLQEALASVGREMGVTVVAPGDLVRGKRAPAVSGTFTADEAVARILAGSGLQARRSSSGAIIVGQQQTAPPSAAPAEPGPGSLNDRPTAPIIADTLVVTGTKQNLTLQETQTSVALFSAQRIEEEVLFTLDDILLRTANVSTVNAQTRFSIRGVDQSGVGNAGTGQTSNVYIDGAPLTVNGQQGAQSLWDIGQVEVLRGPQSTVQGRNALAGAIIIQTQDPTYHWEFKARGQAATQNFYTGSGVISGPIVDRQLAFRVAYDYRTYDGGVTEVITGTPQEFQDSHTVRGKLLWEPDAMPGLRMEFKAEYVETDFGEFNTRFAPVPFNDPAIVDFDPFGKETFTRVRLEKAETLLLLLDVNYEINENWTVIGIGSYEDQDRTTGFCDTSLGQCAFITGPTFTEQYTGEIRLAFDYDRLSGWIGGYYFDNNLRRIQEFTLPAALAGFPVTPPDATVTRSSMQTEKTENYAVFADVTFDLNDKWSFNVGARFDWENFLDTGAVGAVTSDPADCTIQFPFGTGPCTALLPTAPPVELPASFNAFLPRASIIYTVDEDRSVSFSVQRGYRAGGAIDQQNQLVGTVDIVPFDPEFVTNYELAFRSQWFDQRLAVNANIFYTDWEDQQVTIAGPSGNPLAGDAFVDNAGSSRMYGLELSVSAQPTDALSLFFTLGLLDTKFTDFPFSEAENAPEEFRNLRGNRFPAAPRVTVAGGFSYDHPSGFYASGNISYRGAQESDVTNLEENRVGSYVLVNARVGYQFSHYNIYVFANNLFNERFSTRNEFIGFNPGTGVRDVRPNARYAVNEPRIVGVAVEAAF